MAKKSRLIPFRWMPGSWGLVGEAFQRAELAYHYEGEELERQLAGLNKLDKDFDRAMYEIDFKYGRIDAYELERRITTLDHGALDDRTAFEIDHRHGKMDDYSFEKSLAAFDHVDDPSGKEIADIEIDVRYGRMNAKEGAKRIATLRGEPWVGLLEDGFNANEGISGFYFEFDWNDAWIMELQRHGYVGMTDDEIMQQWFADVCRNEAADMIPMVVPFNSGRVINRRSANGSTEYS